MASVILPRIVATKRTEIRVSSTTRVDLVGRRAFASLLVLLGMLLVVAGGGPVAPAAAEPPAKQCGDTIDNDGDGKIDYPADPGCTGLNDNSELDPACIDGRDNDGDGKIDYPADPGCASTADTDETDLIGPPPPQCSDSLDNDLDRVIDFPDDPGCVSALNNDETDPPPPPPPPPPQCSDNADNDADAKIDFPADPGCVSALDNDETDPPPPQCSDGKDNDADAKIDFPADPGCVSALDNDETDPAAPVPTVAPRPVFVTVPAAPQCADGLDNDRDGRFDHPLDFGCASPSDNSEVGSQASAGSSSSQTPKQLSPFPVVRLRGQIVGSGVRVTLLTVQAPVRSRITITCRGPSISCPRTRYTRVTTTSRLRIRLFERRMRASTVLRIFVTKPGMVGKYTRFTIRRRKAPLRLDACADSSNHRVACR